MATTKRMTVRQFLGLGPNEQPSVMAAEALWNDIGDLQVQAELKDEAFRWAQQRAMEAEAQVERMGAVAKRMILRRDVLRLERELAEARGQLAAVVEAATEELRTRGTYADAQIYGRRCKLCQCWWPLDREPYHHAYCPLVGLPAAGAKPERAEKLEEDIETLREMAHDFFEGGKPVTKEQLDAFCAVGPGVEGK
jgi:hypothetical protein